MKLSRLFFVAFLSLALAACAWMPAQEVKRAPTPAPSASPTAQTTPETYEGLSIERETSEPYTGDLSVFEDSEREKNLQIDRVMELLGIKEGSRVADIGAGSGWFTVRAARRVGERGLVYAVEINEEFIKHIEKRAAEEKLPQVRTVLGKEDDPLLPERGIDAVLILKTYHEITQPVRLLARLRKSLTDGALVGIIDRNGEGDDHGIGKETVIREAEQAGYTLVSEHDFVKPDKMDYFLVFRARR
jgi:protein-L-isoaspartate O-methyltransferase